MFTNKQVEKAAAGSPQEVGTFTFVKSGDSSKLSVAAALGYLVLEGYQDLGLIKIVLMVSTSSFIPSKVFVMSVGESHPVSGNKIKILNCRFAVILMFELQQRMLRIRTWGSFITGNIFHLRGKVGLEISFF